MSLLDDLDQNFASFVGLEKYEEIIAGGDEVFATFNKLSVFVASACMLLIGENSGMETLFKSYQTATLTGMALYRQMCIDYGLDVAPMEAKYKKGEL